MHFLEGLGAASTLFIFVATSPVDLQPRAGNSIIHQTTPKPFKKSGPAAILATYGKYNASAPKDVIRAVTANDGKVSANPTQFDTEYLSPVIIGGQTLNLDIDTGSSDLSVVFRPIPDHCVCSYLADGYSPQTLLPLNLTVIPYTTRPCRLPRKAWTDILGRSSMAMGVGPGGMSVLTRSRSAPQQSQGKR